MICSRCKKTTELTAEVRLLLAIGGSENFVCSDCRDKEEVIFVDGVSLKKYLSSKRRRIEKNA